MKAEKPFDADELNLISLAQQYSHEDKARKLLESMRWPNGPVCPHCKNHEDKPIYAIKPQEGSRRPCRKGLYCCGACRKQFTVMVNTIFSDSHIALSKWLMAMFIVCSSKKSISAHQLHRMLGITYRSAWFLAHRIRFIMGEPLNAPKLKGPTEIDETFIGGRGEARTAFLRKTPVVALIERGGQMRARPVSNVPQKNLRKIIDECVDKSAVVYTDEHAAYVPALKGHAKHETVVHSRYEYARHNPDGTVAHINTCESFFSLLKRGVVGAWHHVSREHLSKYAGEFEFRWNTRKMTDGKRLERAVGRIEGKRLTYRQAI